MDTDPAITDKGRLLFGAGFVFGVAVTMLLTALSVATLVGEGGLATVPMDLVVTLTAGLLFTLVIGASLWILAFPENRVRIPLTSIGGDDGDGAARDDATEDRR